MLRGCGPEQHRPLQFSLKRFWQQRMIADLETGDKLTSVRNQGASVILSPRQHYFQCLGTCQKNSLFSVETPDASSSRKFKTGEVVKHKHTPTYRLFKVPVVSFNRITVWLKLERTCGGHIVQPPNKLFHLLKSMLWDVQ